MSSPERPKSEPLPELNEVTPGESSRRRIRRSRTVPRFGILVNSPPNRRNDDDSVFDNPINRLSPQASMSYPPRRPSFERNSNQSNNFESNPINDSPQIPLDDAFDPSAGHFGFLPEIELSSNVDESSSSCELIPRRSVPGLRRCRSTTSSNEEPGPSQRMRFDDPPQDAFDFNEINHEIFMQEIDNIDDDDPTNLHNSTNVTSKSSSLDRLHNGEDPND